jgi:hypothetical protein
MARAGRDAFWKCAGTLISVLLCASDGLAAERGAVVLGLSLGQESVDILSESDSRPNPRPFLFTRVGLDYHLGPHWAVVTAGKFGGSFFDFKGPGVSGNVEETIWSARVGFDWIHHDRGGCSAYAGAGYEYGEARSWLKNLLVSEDGPRNILSGGFVTGGAEARVTQMLSVFGELEAFAFHGRAELSTLVTRYNWLGRSIGVSVGLRYSVSGRGESSSAAE